jgi:hypothetical protein
MNELTRMAYLQAMGTDAYVSRGPLAGAAPTRRLAVRAKAREVEKAPPSADQIAPMLSSRPSAKAANSPLARPAGTPFGMVDKPLPEKDRSVSRPALAQRQRPGDTPTLRFSLVAVGCGGWLWLEELQQARASTEQIQLIQAMALAMSPRVASTDGVAPAAAAAQVSQFDWPIHGNHQLDQGEEAARSGICGFVQRRLDQEGYRGLVLLGAGSQARVPAEQLHCGRIGRTVGTAEMLRDPLLKKQAWRDLCLLLPAE